MSGPAIDKPDETGAADLGDLAIDREAEVPIGVQLAWALRSRIADGRLTPGQRLPGLRELAEVVGVNVNTVRAVYQRLEREALIDSQQGSGTFVARTPTRPSAVSSIAAHAAREARETGVDPRDVAAALYVSPDSPASSAGDAVERRRLLRTQIAALERALGDMEAAHPGVAPAPTPTRAGIGPALLSAEELEDVRALLVRRLATVQDAIDAQLADAADPPDAPAARPARSKAQGKAPAPKRAPRPRPSSRPAPAGT